MEWLNYDDMTAYVYVLTCVFTILYYHHVFRRHLLLWSVTYSLSFFFFWKRVCYAKCLKTRVKSWCPLLPNQWKDWKNFIRTLVLISNLKIWGFSFLSKTSSNFMIIHTHTHSHAGNFSMTRVESCPESTPLPWRSPTSELATILTCKAELWHTLS